jgi:hypothetical protein
MSDRAVCTIATASHLPTARALAAGLAATDPGVLMYVLVAERDEAVPVAAWPGADNVRVVRMTDLSDPSTVERMAFYYTPFELCNALKPFLHDYMFRRTPARQWLYLDADILPFASLAPVYDELAAASILLSPHSKTPLPDELDNAEIAFVRCGVYNGGFVGLNRGDVAESFVRWFKARLTLHCLADGMLFVDQLWLNLVPLYFPGTAFCRHPGANVGHWNLHERRLGTDATGRYTANGEPILFVHYSGWDIDRPDAVSPRYAPQFPTPAADPWPAMAARYRAALLAAGHAARPDGPYTFGRFDDGSAVTDQMRRLYHADVAAGRPGTGSPFARGAEFRERVRVPWPRRARRVVRRWLPFA